MLVMEMQMEHLFIQDLNQLLFYLKIVQVLVIIGLFGIIKEMVIMLIINI